MKPKNTGKDLSLQAPTANQKLKQNAHTKDGYDVEVLAVLYKTRLVAQCQLYYISWEGDGSPSPRPPRYPFSLRSRTCNTLKLKPFDISRRSHCVKFSQ